MASWLMKSIVGVFLFLIVAACQQAPSSPTGLLPPGELPNDNNEPVAITGITNSGQGASASSDQNSPSTGEQISTRLPSASPAGVTQLTSGMTLSPGG